MKEMILTSRLAYTFVISLIVYTLQYSPHRQCFRHELANDYAFSKAKEKEMVRVISYNIRGDSKIDREKGNAWNHRKYAIQKLLDSYQPDIIGLQEVSSNYTTDLSNLFPNYEIIAFDVNEQKDKDVALLFQKDRFVLYKSNFFWLSEQPDGKPFPAWDSRGPRIVVWAKLYDVITSTIFTVFCTHFDSTGHHARRESARLLITHQQKIAQGTPVVILGDFNTYTQTNTSNDVYHELTSDPLLLDIRDSCQENHYGPDGTWIGWSYDPVAAEPGTVGPRLDHIFVKNFKVVREGVLRNSVDEHENVIAPTCPSAKYPSDHLPLIADLLPDRQNTNN